MILFVHRMGSMQFMQLAQVTIPRRLSWKLSQSCSITERICLPQPGYCTSRPSACTSSFDLMCVLFLATDWRDIIVRACDSFHGWRRSEAVGRDPENPTDRGRESRGSRHCAIDGSEWRDGCANHRSRKLFMSVCDGLHQRNLAIVIGGHKLADLRCTTE